jgi:hypothetical protein
MFFLVASLMLDKLFDENQDSIGAKVMANVVITIRLI